MPDTKKSVPIVSVVIPAYNCASFLPETLTSVLAQTYKEFEVIVVDDGSTDHTEEVLAPFRERVTIIVQENRGLPGARNSGIRQARGEFIALLDADDSWMADKLARQMPRFGDPEIGIVASDFSTVYEDGTIRPSYMAERPLSGEGFVFEQYIRSRFLFPSTMIFRSACFTQCGLFDEGMLACEDVELFARMCLHWKVALVDAPLTKRFEGLHNITANRTRIVEYTIRALTQVLEKEKGMSSHEKAVVYRELGQQCWWSGYEAFDRGSMAKSRARLLSAIRYDSGNLRRCIPLLAASLLPTPVVARLRVSRKK